MEQAEEVRMSEKKPHEEKEASNMLWRFWSCIKFFFELGFLPVGWYVSSLHTALSSLFFASLL